MTKLSLAKLGVVLLFLGLNACTEKDEQKTPKANTKQQVNVEVLAWVNQSPITEPQFNYALRRITGGAIVPAGAGLQDKVMDSVISSRAMSLLAEQNLNTKQKSEIDIKVQAYREELLVKSYIDQHASPKPVTSKMVEDYYQQHPEEFGGEKIKGFEYITTVGDLDDDQRKALKSTFSTYRKNGKTLLSESASQLKTQGFPVKYKSAEMRLGLIEEPIRSLLLGLKTNEFSQVYNDQNQMVLLRLTASKTIAAKPLVEVTTDIRKKLAPIQLKKSITALIEKAKQQVDIKHPKTGGE